jgi:hypothetical protein
MNTAFPSRLADLFAVDRLGVVVFADRICACVVRNDNVIWTQQARVLSPELLEAALTELLTTCPVARAGRRIARVAFGPSRVVTKRLVGLGAASAAERQAIVKQVPERYFILQQGVPSVSTLFEASNGDTWASAFVRTDLEVVEAVLRTLGWRTPSIVPAVTLVPPPSIVRDGDQVVLVTANEFDQFEAVCTEADEEGSTAAQRSVDGAALAEIASRSLLPNRMLAYLTDGRSTLTHGRARRLASRGLVMAAFTALGGLCADLVHWRFDVHAVGAGARTSRIVQAQLDSARDLEAQLARLERFARRYPSTVERLADLATATDTVGTIDRLLLTDTVAELAMRVGRGAEVPGILGGLSWVRDARLVGGVAREGAEAGLERVALRLSLFPNPASRDTAEQR